uniref:Enolase n=1 Tax=Oryctolagus cuniculus TaxID=9986 RepID=A0A5F9CKZ8_RABIT
MSALKSQVREIFDSRGYHTVEVDLYTAKSLFQAAMPSGPSTVIFEAVELQDNDKTQYMGEGVSKAAVPALVSKKLNIIEQEIDKLIVSMPRTENKFKFAANVLCP